MEEKQVSDKEVENIFTDCENTLEKEQTVSSPFLPSYTKRYSETHFELTTLNHTWKIDQFRHFCQIKNTITFPSFPEIGQFEILMNVSRQDNQIKAIQFCIITCKAFNGSCYTTVRSLSGRYVSSRSISGHISNTTLLVEFSPENLKYDLGDALIIDCEFKIFRNLINKSIQMNLLPFLTVIPKDVAYFEDSTFEFPPKDQESVKFKVGEKQYVVSTKLLCATNSSYFKNICLTHEGREKDMTNELVTDDEVKSFQQILLYILTGSIQQYNSYNTLKNLLITANKYDVQTLKLTCEHYLLHDIMINNAVKLIQLALSSDAKFLGTHSATFIKFNIEEIRNTKEFLDLPQEDLNKITELIEKTKIHEVSSNKFFSSSSMTDKNFSLVNHIIKHS